MASCGESCRSRKSLSNRRSHYANGIGSRNEKRKKAEEWLERTYSKSYWADMTCPSAASKQLLRAYSRREPAGSCIYGVIRGRVEQSSESTCSDSGSRAGKAVSD